MQSELLQQLSDIVEKAESIGLCKAILYLCDRDDQDEIDFVIKRMSRLYNCEVKTNPWRIEVTL